MTAVQSVAPAQLQAQPATQRRLQHVQARRQLGAHVRVQLIASHRRKREEVVEAAESGREVVARPF